MLGLCLFGLLAPVQAAEEETENGTELPDLEFLEFLGAFETDEGEWIDPGSLLTPEFGDLLNAAIAVEEENLNGGSINNDAGNDQQDD